MGDKGRKDAEQAIALFDNSVDVEPIVLTKNGFASSSRNKMAWPHLTEI
jgi:hypothetical protein